MEDKLKQAQADLRIASEILALWRKGPFSAEARASAERAFLTALDRVAGLQVMVSGVF